LTRQTTCRVPRILLHGHTSSYVEKQHVRKRMHTITTIRLAGKKSSVSITWVFNFFPDGIYLNHYHSERRFRTSYAPDERIKKRISSFPILTTTGMCEQISVNSPISNLNENSFSDSTVVSWVARKEWTVRVQKAAPSDAIALKN